MRMVICSVRDKVAGCYGRPMFLQSVGVAIRSFMDEANRSAPDNQLNNHPADFALYHFGYFDDEEGTFDLLPHPAEIARGELVYSDVVNEKQIHANENFD